MVFLNISQSLREDGNGFDLVQTLDEKAIGEQNQCTIKSQINSFLIFLLPKKTEKFSKLQQRLLRFKIVPTLEQSLQQMQQIYDKGIVIAHVVQD